VYFGYVKLVALAAPHILTVAFDALQKMELNSNPSVIPSKNSPIHDDETTFKQSLG
jgi:hypothetical protein